MTAWFRITVEDLETGEKSAVEIAEGDYMLIPTGSCHVGHIQAHANGTHVITVKDHRPAGKPRTVEAARS